MADEQALYTKLALVTVAVNDLRNVSMFLKAPYAERCLTLTLDLLGELVDRLETLERKLPS